MQRHYINAELIRSIVDKLDIRMRKVERASGVCKRQFYNYMDNLTPAKLSTIKKMAIVLEVKPNKLIK